MMMSTALELFQFALMCAPTAPPRARALEVKTRAPIAAMRARRVMCEITVPPLDTRRGLGVEAQHAAQLCRESCSAEALLRHVVLRLLGNGHVRCLLRLHVRDVRVQRHHLKA